MTWRLLIVSVLLTWCCLGVSFGQTNSLRTAFSTIDSLYSSGSYIRAEVEARRLLEYSNLTDTAYAEIHKDIAFSLIAQGKTELAKERFAMLLSLFPSYSLDPVFTSPKILVIFNDAKRAFLTAKKPIPETIKFPADAGGTAVSYRALLFPGWEQLYSGRKISGIIFLGAGILSLGSGITFEFLRSSARQDYLAERNPSVINDKYDIYNRYYKAEIVSFVVFALTYIASEFDAFTASSTPALRISSGSLVDNSTRFTFMIKF